MRTKVKGWLALLALVLAGPAAAAGLTDLLMSKVGVTQPQAVGGAGSIFQLAKSQMTAANFAKISQAVPGMDKYLAAVPAIAPAAVNATPAVAPAVPATPTASSKLADVAKGALAANPQLGGLGGKVQTLQKLAPAFEALGMKPKLAGKFVPVVVDYLSSSGGASTGKLLAGALGF